MTCYTVSLDQQQTEILRETLQKLGWESRVVPHSTLAMRGPDVQVVVYNSGKCLVQGKGTAEFVEFTLEPIILKRAELGYSDRLHPEMYVEHIGVDESGKGDFFGPLVVAGVYASAEGVAQLQKWGVRDSKKISSSRVVEDLYRKIRRSSLFAVEVILLQPSKYNELQQKMHTTNQLLGWAHAKVASKLLERQPQCRRVVFDKFAKDPLTILKFLTKTTQDVEVVQRHRAEEDPVVAAASIVARRFFLRWLTQTSKDLGVTIPAGASITVKECARLLLQRIGKEKLSAYVKTHFKTWKELNDST